MRSESKAKKTDSLLTEAEKPSLVSGGYLTKFNMGRLRPAVQPLTLLYTFLAEKVTFCIHLLKIGTPFNYLYLSPSYE